MGQATAEAIYSNVVKPLPASERFRLATLILEQISPRGVVPINRDSHEWTEEDMRDLTTYSLRYAAQSFGEEEADAEGRLTWLPLISLASQASRGDPP